MFKKIAMMMLVGGLGIMVLAGCSNKSSRKFIEGKAAALSKVYPTENLEDLFDKFPGGFQITSKDLYEYEESGYKLQSISLHGNSQTRQISGTISEKQVSFDQDEKRSENFVYTGEVVYQDGKIQLKDPTANIKIKSPTLLLQEFTINKDSLSKLKMGGKGYSYETGSADIDYTLSDPILNTYMGVEQDKELKMIIYIMHETVENKAYSYTLDIKDGHNYHTELIEGY
ncbi:MULTISPECIES: hypothetical protein [Streptococcus]|jgi:hypothetical protein|uniref:Lipoprotein n=1 Tax=Streptococcus mitis TaxID=28037 RepID=A0A428CK39_STRMT|nr:MULTISPECIES: hypothetical protein [Streptococcus]MBZ2096509.1 hypothetical protein [Streptococcus oralis]MBZ2102160.1 hypothetical protein [Streptococcus oralis]RSI78380.1 hypothetical protein D8856_03765 [Streptococcus mitis]